MACHTALGQEHMEFGMNNDLDQIFGSMAQHAVYRMFGENHALNRIGIGFIDKTNQRGDDGGVRHTYSLVHVLRGKAQYIDHDGVSYQLQPGSCFLRIPGADHQLYIDASRPWLECWMDCGRILYNTLVELQCLRGVPQAWAGTVDLENVRRYARLVDQLHVAADDELPHILASWMALHADQVRHARLQQDSAEDTMMVQACGFLADDANRHLSLRAFCNQQDIGYEKLRKQFTQHMGTSPESYRIRRRMERACQLPKNIITWCESPRS